MSGADKEPFIDLGNNYPKTLYCIMLSFRINIAYYTQIKTIFPTIRVGILPIFVLKHFGRVGGQWGGAGGGLKEDSGDQNKATSGEKVIGEFRF
jgi:hypothetical protein